MLVCMLFLNISVVPIAGRIVWHIISHGQLHVTHCDHTAMDLQLRPTVSPHTHLPLTPTLTPNNHCSHVQTITFPMSNPQISLC